MKIVQHIAHGKSTKNTINKNNITQALRYWWISVGCRTFREHYCACRPVHYIVWNVIDYLQWKSKQRQDDVTVCLNLIFAFSFERDIVCGTVQSLLCQVSPEKFHYWPIGGAVSAVYLYWVLSWPLACFIPAGVSHCIDMVLCRRQTSWKHNTQLHTVTTSSTKTREKKQTKNRHTNTCLL